MNTETVVICARVSPEIKAELIRRAAAEGKNVNQLISELAGAYLGKTSSPIDAVVSNEVDAIFDSQESRARLKRAVGNVLNEITAKKVDAIVLEKKEPAKPADEYLDLDDLFVEEPDTEPLEAEKAEFEPHELPERKKKRTEKPEVDRCPGCEVELKHGMKYCWNCGAELVWDEGTPAKESEGWKTAALGIIGGSVVLYALYRVLAALAGGRR